MPSPTVSSNQVVQDQYEAQVATTAALTLTLRQLWASVDPLSSQAAERAYREGVNLLASQFGSMSGSIADSFYRDMRAQANALGSVSIKPAALPPRSLVEADLDWAFRAGQEMADTAARIQARVEAAMQKAVADVGRDQTVIAVEGDDRALGFARVARPGACAWCLSLSFRRTNGRIGVYKSRSSAGQIPANAAGEVNRFHNKCHCEVVPIFTADYQPEPQVAAAEHLYNESTVESARGESLNDFRKALYAQRGGRPLEPQAPRPVVTPIAGADALTALLGRLATSGATAA